MRAGWSAPRPSLGSPLFGVLVMTAAAALLFYLFQRQLSGVWFAVGAHPEVLAELERSREDQKALAALDPGAREQYRERFTTLDQLLRRLLVLEQNRDLIAGRYEQILLLLFAGTVVLITGAAVVRQSRQTARLRRLQGALADLAEGRTDLEIGDRGRDVVGRIAAMVEQTSRLMARDRRRLAALQNLSAWQEAARRHAHEMRTPLTGARLELGRLGGLLERETLDHASDIRQAAQSAAQEIERLGRFTQEFTSFARIPRPQLAARDLVALVRELAVTFAAAWPNLRLVCAAPADGPEHRVRVDRDLLRQVVVNLCDNSSLAVASTADGGARTGMVRFTLGRATDTVWLDVADDGPGVAEAVRPRLFEPYTTTRGIGQGMGLGLAICKKILLDHGGDLELRATSPAGTTLRLNLPAADDVEPPATLEETPA